MPPLAGQEVCAPPDAIGYCRATSKNDMGDCGSGERGLLELGAKHGINSLTARAGAATNANAATTSALPRLASVGPASGTTHVH